MSSEDFKSFIVTDPDIVDEGIDISGIKRTTDTSPLLLGDLEPGLRYDPTLQSSYSDLLNYFSGGLPMLPETPVVTPPDISSQLKFIFPSLLFCVKIISPELLFWIIFKSPVSFSI